MGKGQTQRLLDLAKSALATSDLAVFHNLLGKAYELNKNLAAAAEELPQAIRFDPRQVNYYLDLAQLFLKHNTPEPADASNGARGNMVNYMLDGTTHN